MDANNKKNEYSLPSMDSSFDDLDSLDLSKANTAPKSSAKSGGDEFGLFDIDFDSELSSGKFDKKKDSGYKIIKEEDLVIEQEQAEQFYDPDALEKPASITELGENRVDDLSDHTSLFKENEKKAKDYSEEIVKFMPKQTSHDKDAYMPDFNLKYSINFTDLDRTDHIIAKNEAKVYVAEDAYEKLNQNKKVLKKTLEVSSHNVDDILTADGVSNDGAKDKNVNIISGNNSGGLFDGLGSGLSEKPTNNIQNIMTDDPFQFINGFNDNADFFANKTVSNISIPISPEDFYNADKNKRNILDFNKFENLSDPSFKSNKSKIDSSVKEDLTEVNAEKKKEKEVEAENKEFVTELIDRLNSGSYKLLCRPINDGRKSEVYGYDFVMSIVRTNGLSYEMSVVNELASKHQDLRFKIDRESIYRACMIASSPTRQKAEFFSVGISNEYFLHDNFVTEFLAILENLKKVPSNLCLNFDESVLLSNSDIIKTRFALLKKLGVTVSISNFGDNFFEFTKLPDFSLDYVRVSQQLVHDFLEKQDAKTIINDILAYSKLKRTLPIAMGVDSNVIREGLLTLGFNLMQGKSSIVEKKASSLPAKIDSNKKPTKIKASKKVKRVKRIKKVRRMPSNMRAMQLNSMRARTGSRPRVASARRRVVPTSTRQGMMPMSGSAMMPRVRTSAARRMPVSSIRATSPSGRPVRVMPPRRVARPTAMRVGVRPTSRMSVKPRRR